MVRRIVYAVTLLCYKVFECQNQKGDFFKKNFAFSENVNFTKFYLLNLQLTELQYYLVYLVNLYFLEKAYHSQCSSHTHKAESDDYHSVAFLPVMHQHVGQPLYGLW